MIIKTSEIENIKSLFRQFKLPKPDSYKGHNGKVLIIGGSSLFHSASLWAAEVSSHFVDMVHYSSTLENEKIFFNLKKIFRNGIIVPQKELDSYIKEDDAVLVGPGMMRDGEEGRQTYELTKKMFEEYPSKNFVFDAGALQMMEKQWFLKLKKPAIITPHKQEFERLFNIKLDSNKIDETALIVKKTALDFGITILLKIKDDIISDGKKIFIVKGGNAGLTKGGTGDILAGLSASFLTGNDSLNSAVFASILLKATADRLYEEKGYWYNIDDIINKLPELLKAFTI